jgi:DNA-binding transcriptional LysR family regulator
MTTALHLQPGGDCHLLYESAASGLGVAIALDALVEPYIHDGRLVPVSDIQLIIPKKFYLALVH